MQWLALPIMVALLTPVAAVAQPQKSDVVQAHKAKKAKRVGTETADFAPLVRIRHADGESGLTPLQFAHWLQAHPDLVPDTGMTRNVSASTRLLNRSTENFVEADRNRDGRVSAEELADFVQPEPITSLTGHVRAAF